MKYIVVSNNENKEVTTEQMQEVFIKYSNCKHETFAFNTGFIIEYEVGNEKIFAIVQE